MDYETKATQYAEKYGIINYEVDGNNMAYNESFPAERVIYTVRVDLDTMREVRTGHDVNELTK